MKIKKLIFFALLFASLSAAESSTDKNKYLADVQPPAGSSFACPAVKDNYYTRIYSIDYFSGTTTCLIFEKHTKEALSDTVSYTNPNLFEQNQQRKKDALSANTTTIGSSAKAKERYQNLKTIKDNYSDAYTAGSTEFLNLPKYMISGLTIDNKVIDVANTIQSNSVQLHSDYTLYPNSYLDYSATNEPLGSGGLLYELGSRVLESWGWIDEAQIEKAHVSKLSNYETEITSTTKDTLTNIVIFLVQVFERFNHTLLEIKTYILFTILPVTAFFFFGSKITKKIENLRDNESILERTIMTLVALFVFYFSTATIQVPNEDGGEGKISQVAYHSWFRTFLYSGSEYADELSKSTLDAYMLYKFRDIGVISQKNAQDLENQRVTLSMESNFLEKTFQDECTNVYNTDEMRDSVKLYTGLDLMFPPQESIKNDAALLDGGINWYTNNFLKVPDTSPIYSVSGCANVFKTWKEKQARLNQIANELLYISEMESDTIVNEKLETLAKTQYRNQAELGWIAMPLLGMLDNSLKELEVIKNFSNKIRSEGLNEEEDDARNDKKIEGNANITTEIDSALINNLPYVMIPFFSTLKNEFSTMMTIPVVKWFVPQITNTGAFFAAVAVTKFFISMLPSIVILSASLLLIGYWLVSILIYYIVTPFLLAFALASSQTEVIKKYLMSGIVLTLKPLIIVISIVVAWFAMEFLMNLNDLLIEWSFGNVQQLFSKVDFSLSLLMMLKVFLQIVSTIIISIFGFYIIFNGSSLILGLFGMKDIDIDVQSGVGDKIDSKSGKFM